jgi:hypothetical protein
MCASSVRCPAAGILLNMRAVPRTIILCLLLSLAGEFTAALPPPKNDAPAGAPASPASAPAAATPAAAATTTSAVTDSDAAAKHAKRTVCLKNAKAKKLVGAQKTTFIKDCVAAP